MPSNRPTRSVVTPTRSVQQPARANQEASRRIYGTVPSNDSNEQQRNRLSRPPTQRTVTPIVSTRTQSDPRSNDRSRNHNASNPINSSRPEIRDRTHRHDVDGDRDRNRRHRPIVTADTANVYHRDRDGARSVYLEHRRNAEDASERRRDRERRRAIDRLTEKQEMREGRHDDRRFGDRHSRHHIDKRHHRHHDHCGHYFYNNRWHDFPRAHRHHAHCGHHFRSGIWVSFTLGHVHGVGCGHFYESGVWLSHVGSIHRHGPGCGHYFYDGLWHNTACYHIHGPGCGHYYYDDYWHDFPRTHIHSDYCGHLYDGSRWLVVTSDSHVHGPNCGHHYFAGQWHAYPRDYYTMNRQDSLFFFIDLGDYRNRNLPDWAYDAYLDSGSPIDVFQSSTPLAKAYAAFAKGRYYDSLVQFNLAVRLDAENALVYLARAQAHLAVKDYRSAYEDIVKGMDLMPEWADVRLNLTEIYSNTDDLVEHTNALEQWVERYPRDFKAHFVLGYFYYFHQDYEAAKNELVYALSWDEELPAARLLMENILAFEAESEVITRDPIQPPSEDVEVTTE